MNESAAQPRVTWLLPVRNGMPYIERTLASIAQQQYDNHEIIAWDNGSTDGTLEALCRWIPDRIAGRVVGDRPMGLGASLAAMVKMSRSELCARIDADDLCEPDRLQQQTDYMQAHPRVAVVGSAVRLIDEHDQPLPDRPSLATDDADVRWRLRFCNALNHPTVMFRRGMILGAGNYRDVMPIEDFDLWVRVALKHEMANLPQPLVRYRVLDSSVSASHRGRIDAIRRQITHEYSDALFPGTHRYILDRLLRLTGDADDPRVTLGDCIALRRAATRAAMAIGQPVDYFRRTELYRVQSRSLNRRWLKAQPIVAAAWSTIKRRAA
jgi:glycosyltransferase involved in cell wall biosynthesis